MRTITLPDGGTAVVRGAGEMTVAGRRAVHAGVARIGRGRLAEILAGTGDMDALDPVDRYHVEELAAAATWAFLESWTLGPAPASPAAVLALPDTVREALDTAVAVEGAAAIEAEMSRPWRA